MKDQTLKIRLSAEDRKRLAFLEKHYPASASAVIRMLIKEKFDEIMES